MPKGPKLADEGRIRTDEEYLAWAVAVTKTTEDVFASTNYDKWTAHYRSTYPGLSPDATLSENQLRGLWNKGMTRKFTSFPGAGINTWRRVTRTSTYIQYTDIKTGRFIRPGDAFSRMKAWEVLKFGL